MAVANKMLIGSNMFPEALAFARKLLQGDPLTHPDCHIYEPTTKKSMGVEVAQAILSHTASIPRGEYHVVIIKGFNLLTVDAQNMLLKLIEESNDVVVIGVAKTTENILSTISSRMKYVYQTRESIDTFMSSGGKYYAYFAENEEQEIVLEKVYKELVNKTYHFTRALDMIKEGKDSKEYKGSYKPIVSLITSVMVNEKNLKALSYINSSVRNIDKWTNKDAFLFFIELENIYGGN